MNDIKLDSPVAIKTFLGGAEKVDFKVTKEARYEWIAGTLKCTNFFKLTKKEKGPVIEYIERITGYSWAQLKRLIAQYRKHHWIGRKSTKRHTFAKKYTHHDILLLVKTPVRFFLQKNSG